MGIVVLNAVYQTDVKTWKPYMGMKNGGKWASINDEC